MKKYWLLVLVVSALLLISACSLASSLPGGTVSTEADPVGEGAAGGGAASEDAVVSTAAAEGGDDSGFAAETPLSESSGSVPDDAAGIESAASGLCYNAFYPIREDMLWTYETNSGGTPGSYQQTYRDISADRFTIINTFADDQVAEVTWECSEDGMLSTEFAALSMLPGSDFEFNTSEYSGIWLPREDEWEVGKEWDTLYVVAMESDLEGISFTTTMRLELHSRIAAVEPVSVAAGDFPSAYRVDTTGILRMEELGTENPMNYSSWFVRDVGMVQSVMAGTPGLSEGNYETKLVSLVHP